LGCMLSKRPLVAQMDVVRPTKTDGRSHNGDKLDNRRCNLRMVDNTANQWNKLQKSRLGVRGVYKQPGGRFNAKFRVQSKLHCLGSFATLKCAIEARDKFELSYVPLKTLYLRK